MNLRPVNLLMGASLAIFFAYATAGCPTPAPKPPPHDASDASDAPFDAGFDGPVPEGEPDAALKYPACAAACAKMAEKAIDCPEAAKPDGGKTCYRLCADAEESGKFNLKPACIAGAKDVAGVRACGTVRCKK